MTEKVDALLDDMMDELRDADKYAGDAANCSNPQHQKIFAEMARQELSHYHNLAQMASEDIIGKDSWEMETFKYLSKKFKDWENRILFDLSKIK